MTYQTDFFRDVRPPKGLQYIPDFISPAEEKFLIKEIKNLEWQNIKMHGVIAKRKVVHFGMDYSYSSRILTKTAPPPKFMNFLMDKVSSAMNVPLKEISEILISHYPVGAPIGWHRDAPMFESLLGISLQSGCYMRFRHITDKTTLKFEQYLERRSAYILEGDARWKWQHHIPPVKEERFSITFRTLVQ